MKTVKIILSGLILVLFASTSAIAQTKVIAVINKADWCPVCQKNGERAMKAFMENNKDKSIQFVANNVTNDETKTKSAVELKKHGLDKVMENYNGTGVVFFFNSKTKALISQISLAKDNQELALALKTAKEKLN
jgi:thiol:disulfide interchange protein